MDKFNLFENIFVQSNLTKVQIIAQEILSLMSWPCIYKGLSHPWYEQVGHLRKLSLKFAGPFEVLKRVRRVAYRITLSTSLSKIHDVFRVSIVRRFIISPSQVVKLALIE